MEYLRKEWYDSETENIMRENLAEADSSTPLLKEETKERKKMLYDRWKMNVLGMETNYITEYYSLSNPTIRNMWFKKYLNLPSHDINKMPKTLLPLNEIKGGCNDGIFSEAFR